MLTIEKCLSTSFSTYRIEVSRLLLKSIPVFLSLFFILTLGSEANATITSISSDWCQSCLPGAAHRIVAGKQTSMLVKGQFVDLSTRVEISGSGVSVSFGTRTGGSNSSIEVKFNVDASASLGDRTVKLRYAIESSGPDTFTVKVVRGGQITNVQRRVQFSGTTRLVAADAIPVNERVTLVITGNRIGNASIATNTALKNPQKLSGATENQCEIEVEFTRTGGVDINLVDADVGPQPGNLLFKFYYGGADQVNVVGTAAPQQGPVIPRVPIAGGATSPATFLDVAPRANMLNIFRRTGNSITVNGQAFLQVDDRWCSENGVQTPAVASTAKIITLPDLTWGISNVGTGNIPGAFDSQLSSNGQVLQTQTLAAGSLLPGGTFNVTLHRTRSQVRVIRFAPPTQSGCFVNPNDSSFFEDPPFTVKVDTGNALPESATNRANNSRNY